MSHTKCRYNKTAPITEVTCAIEPYHAQRQMTHPQSQSFSRSYGSNLPTSLIYVILSTRGYSPWRPAAVMSTIAVHLHYHTPFSRKLCYSPNGPENEPLLLRDEYSSGRTMFILITQISKKRELLLG